MSKEKCVCNKCNGTGIIKEWADANHLNGICFKCKGFGYVMVDLEKEKIKQTKRQENQVDNFLNNILQPTRKAIETCNSRKKCVCNDCKHKEYCNLKYQLEIQEKSYKDMVNAQP